MNDYLNTFAGRLSEHNKRGLTFFKDDLSAYYGEQDFFGALHELGHTAYTRSNVPAVHKDKHNHDFKKVGKVCQCFLSTFDQCANFLCPYEKLGSKLCNPICYFGPNSYS